MENVREQIYYVTLCIYVRKLSFNHFDSTFLSWIFPHIPAQFSSIQPLQLLFLVFVVSKTRGRCNANNSASLLNHPDPATYNLPPPPPTYLTYVPLQGNCHAVQFNYTSLCAAGGSLRFPYQTAPENSPNEENDGGEVLTPVSLPPPSHPPIGGPISHPIPTPLLPLSSFLL